MKNSIVEKSIKKEYLKRRRIIYFKYFLAIYIILCISFLVISNNSEYFPPNISDRLLFLFPILIPSLIFASYCVGEKDEILIKDKKFDSEGYCQFRIYNKLGFMDRKGNWIIEPLYDSLWEFDEEGYCRAEINKKWGYIDRKGNWIIEPLYDYLWGFDEKGYCLVQINKKKGSIDRKGNWILQPIFKKIENWNHDYKVEINKKYGCIDYQGNWILQPIYDYIDDDFDEEGYLLAKIDKKYGFIDKQGNWLIQPIYDKLDSFNSLNFCPAILNRNKGRINRKGEWLSNTIS